LIGIITFQNHLIGNTNEIDKAINYLKKFSKIDGEGIEILIHTLNTENWKVKEEKFKFEKSDF
jgi:DNA-directed RNA polymerase subunit F